MNENFVIYKGEKFIIKNAVSKVEGQKVSMDITAYHVMFEFQITSWNNLMTIVVIKEKEYTLSQYLEYGFKNQRQM